MNEYIYYNKDELKENQDYDVKMNLSKLHDDLKDIERAIKGLTIAIQSKKF